MKAPLFAPLALVLLLLEPRTAAAQDNAADIIRKAESQQPSSNSRIEMTMTIHAKAGDAKSTREISLVSYSRGASDSLIEFLEPKSVRGLRVLTLGSDTWAYFPSTGRVKRLGGGSPQDSVQGVGGDFSPEDISGGSLADKYDFRLLASGSDFWQIEGLSLRADAAYRRVIVTVAKADYFITRIEYHTAADGAFKVLTLGGAREIGGKKIATLMVMENLVTGSKTEVKLGSVQYDAVLEDRLFDPVRFGK